MEERIFVLTGEDVDAVLECMEIELSSEKRKELITRVKAKFEMPWYEYLESYIEYALDDIGIADLVKTNN